MLHPDSVWVKKTVDNLNVSRFIKSAKRQKKRRNTFRKEYHILSKQSMGSLRFLFVPCKLDAEPSKSILDMLGAKQSSSSLVHVKHVTFMVCQRVAVIVLTLCKNRFDFISWLLCHLAAPQSLRRRHSPLLLNFSPKESSSHSVFTSYFNHDEIPLSHFVFPSIVWGLSCTGDFLQFLSFWQKEEKRKKAFWFSSTCCLWTSKRCT